MSRAVSSERLTLRATRVNISPLCAAIGTIVIGKWENDFDAERAHKVLAEHKEFNVDDEEDDDALDAPAALDEKTTVTVPDKHTTTTSAS